MSLQISETNQSSDSNTSPTLTSTLSTENLATTNMNTTTVSTSSTDLADTNSNMNTLSANSEHLISDSVLDANLSVEHPNNSFSNDYQSMYPIIIPPNGKNNGAERGEEVKEEKEEKDLFEKMSEDMMNLLKIMICGTAEEKSTITTTKPMRLVVLDNAIDISTSIAGFVWGLKNTTDLMERPFNTLFRCGGSIASAKFCAKMIKGFSPECVTWALPFALLGSTVYYIKKLNIDPKVLAKLK